MGCNKKIISIFTKKQEVNITWVIKSILWSLLMVALLLSSYMISPSAIAATGTPMYKWEKWNSNASNQTTYSYSWGSEYWDVPYWSPNGNIGFTFNSNTGAFTLTNTQTDPPWNYLIMSGTMMRYRYDGAYLVTCAAVVSSNIITTYSKGSTLIGYVYGTSGLYPNNGDRNENGTHYWYVLVGESISTVTFNSNGGSAVSSQSVYNGSTVAQPSDPTRAGYNFAGWYSDASLTTAWNFSTGTVGASDMTLYAKWTVSQYTVSFNSNGGSSVSSQTLNYGNLITRPGDPTKTGYTFAGWYSDSGLTSAWNFSTGTVSSSMTLYAKWTANTNIVNFDAQGGTCSPSSMSVTYGSTYGSLPTPTKMGYTFAGWYTGTAGSGTLVTSTSTVSITAATTLYASWTLTNDTTPPSAPTGLTSNSVTSSSVTLSWTASTDNIGVTGYNIYRNETLVGSSNTISYTDTGLAANTTYSYTVKAKDTANNISSASNALSVTTLSPGYLNFAHSSYSVYIPSSGSNSITVSASGLDNNGNAISASTIVYSLAATYTGVSINGSTGVITVTSQATAGSVNIIATYGSITGTATLYVANTITGSITLSAVSNNTYLVLLSANNISSFTGKTFTVTYNASALQVTDLCGFTNAKETSLGAISGTGITITNISAGEIDFTIDRTISTGKQWSGVLNIIEFQALATGNTVISMQ